MRLEAEKKDYELLLPWAFSFTFICYLTAQTQP